MAKLFPRFNGYSALNGIDIQDSKDEELLERPSRSKRASRVGYKLLFLVASLATIAASVSAALTIVNRTHTRRTACIDPALRQEWRRVSKEEQRTYLDAVLCLHEVPSAIGWHPDAKLSDDFAWIHTHNPPDHHRTPNFLPWHRYFVHKYELALREQCGYRGSLLYWDWTLDYDHLPESPVFNEDYGFGGDGVSSPEVSKPEEDNLFGGSCIHSGPFSNYDVFVLGQNISRHCLSRGFGRLLGEGHFSGDAVSPTNIESILDEQDYFEFLTRLEGGADNDIPLGMGGDWVLASAPNDPLFFLHHVQVDKIWWLWQQEYNGRRMMQYSGARSAANDEDTSSSPSLDDTLPLPLGDGVSIREILDTEGDLLCYRY